MFQKMSKYHCFSTEAYSSSTREITPCPIAEQKKENMHFHTKRSAFFGGIYTKAASY